MYISFIQLSICQTFIAGCSGFTIFAEKTSVPCCNWMTSNCRDVPIWVLKSKKMHCDWNQAFPTLDIVFQVLVLSRKRLNHDLHKSSNHINYWAVSSFKSSGITSGSEVDSFFGKEESANHIKSTFRELWWLASWPRTKISTNSWISFRQKRLAFAGNLNQANSDQDQQ